MVNQREGIACCESVWDFSSRDLLHRILDNEEEHVDFLETLFDLIRQIGIERHIQLNAAPAPEQKAEPTVGHLGPRSAKLG